MPLKDFRVKLFFFCSYVKLDGLDCYASCNPIKQKTYSKLSSGRYFQQTPSNVWLDNVCFIHTLLFAKMFYASKDRAIESVL